MGRFLSGLFRSVPVAIAAARNAQKQAKVNAHIGHVKKEPHISVRNTPNQMAADPVAMAMGVRPLTAIIAPDTNTATLNPMTNA